MTDFTLESGVVGREYCPACEPEADPIREVLTLKWCWHHTPSAAGSEDAAVPGAPEVLRTGGEAEALECRAIQAMIR